MQVELCVDQGALRRWHVDLVARLAEESGTSVGVRWSGPASRPLPPCVETLLRFERGLHGRSFPALEPVEPGALARHVGRGGAEPDLVIDLSGGKPTAGRLRWSLTFDGGGEDALVSALLSGRSPVISVIDLLSGAPVVSGRPGAEAPHVIGSSMEDAAARATTLLVAALAQSGTLLRHEGASTRELSCRDIARFGAKALARAGLHAAYRTLYRTPHWRIGWRFVDGPGTAERGSHPEEGWRVLPDDGLRFYADPFPVVMAGRTWLFAEELPHATGKGVISALAFDETGPSGAPAPVLELPVHLSYPFVFEEAGEAWMIPESVGAGRVDLFRATRFPGGWVHEATLLDGVEASDATPFRHDGRWWMAATVRDGGSYSDNLHLWSAASITGPWRPHQRNPVLVDAATARPAGRVVADGSRLIRPVQDCRGGYGSAVAFAEITRLDDDGFEQRVIGSIGPGPLWPGRRLHTVNRAGRLECIDGSALSPRLRLDGLSAWAAALPHSLSSVRQRRPRPA